MKNNNGKIAIAIVAMFVVALSIVGVTYAYFTATVNQNTGDEAATVTAGELTATWTGTGASLTANNVVPGWKSDNLSFYDPSYAYVDGQITACVIGHASCNDANAANNVKANESNAATNGQVEPISFTVTNTSDVESIYYAITLQTTELLGTERDGKTAAENAETTRQYLKATLYEGTFDSSDAANNYGGTKVGETQTIAVKTKKIVLAEHIELVATDEQDSKDYFIIIEYVDDGEQNEGQALSFAVKAEIVGVALNTNNNTWYDAAGTPITDYTN